MVDEERKEEEGEKSSYFYRFLLIFQERARDTKQRACLLE